jgi:hypothetical protein
MDEDPGRQSLWLSRQQSARHQAAKADAKNRSYEK